MLQSEMKIKILDAVIACKYETAGGDIQMSQVAARAGVSTRTINRYFPEKNEMIREAAERFLGSKYKEFADTYNHADKSGLNGLERLLFFLGNQSTYYNTNALEAVLFVDANLMCVRMGDVQNKWNSSVGSEIRNIVMSNICEGVEDGSIRSDIEPEILSLLIYANYNGLMQRLTFAYHSNIDEEKKKKISSIFEHYIDMLRGYLRP